MFILFGLRVCLYIIVKLYAYVIGFLYIISAILMIPMGSIAKEKQLKDAILYF